MDAHKVGVFILDDHQMLIDGIKALLAHNKKFEVIGQETNGFNALQKIQELNPHIVITDINMPRMNGMEFTRTLKKLMPQVKICALSMHNDIEIITEMMNCGANAYVLKNTGKSELLEALDKILANQYFISSAISADMLIKGVHPSLETNENKGVRLTDRELEVLVLVAKEMSNAEIATQLSISERTVETHRTNLLRKTESKSVVGLVKYAIEHKLI